MRKVLILSNSDLGLYKFRKDLIQALLTDDNEVYISLPKGDMVKNLIELGCKFIDTSINRRKINPLTELKLFIHYYKMLNEIKPDIVITYTIKPNIYGGIACRLKKIPYAINITGLGTTFQKETIIKKIIILLYKISCKNAKVVFFENEENQNIFISNKIVDFKKTCKLNGAGVNLNEYHFSEYPPDGKLHFLFIGRIMREKGIDELFDAAKQIMKEYNNIVFDIVGPLEEDHKIKIKELEGQGIIEYHGFQSDVKPFIKESHCFVLPSYHEGMSNTLLESGAMGRPIITSNVHGCLEAVQDGKSGYLVSVKNSEDLYSKIKKFIDLPYEDKVKMGLESYNHIHTLFDKQKVVDMTIKEIIK